MNRKDENEPNDELKITDTLRRFLSPILIAIIAYFVKGKLEKIEESVDIIVKTIPLYELRIHNLEIELKEQEDNYNDMIQKLYFLKPDEIKLEKQQRK